MLGGLLKSTLQCYHEAMSTALEQAIACLGSQNKLAEAIGVRQSVVSMWVTRQSRIPAGHCVSIERATSGAVTRRDLRPDDWAAVWPELATKRRTPAKEVA